MFTYSGNRRRPSHPVAKAARRLAAAITLASAATAFAGPLKTDVQIAKERARAYVAAHPSLPRKTREAILRSNIRVGMTKQQVIAAWGRPIEILKFKRGRQEEWTFGCDYPHICIAEDSRHGSPLFDRIRHESVAIIEDGKVTSFRH